MKFDYGFFEESLHRLRRLRAYSIGNGYLMDAPHQIFPDLDLGMAPRILSEESDGWLILTRNYARKPGKGLLNLAKLLQNHLPEDFIEFHQIYNEALVTTRTHPIYLWNEEKIIDGFEHWRDLCPEPIRFIRFGEYWDRQSLYFGLWNRVPGSSEWEVSIAGSDDRDQIYEENIDDEYILGTSFHAWLKSFIERDGLPDPYMTNFGTLDPA